MYPSPRETLSSIADALDAAIRPLVPAKSREMRTIEACVFSLRRVAETWDQFVPMLLQENTEMLALLQAISDDGQWHPEATGDAEVSVFRELVRDMSPAIESPATFAAANTTNLELRELVVRAVDLIDGERSDELLVNARSTRARLHRDIRRFLDLRVELGGRALADRLEWE